MVRVVADSAKWQDLCLLKVPLADWDDVGRDARMLILLVVLPAGMDALRPGKYQ